MGLMNDPAPVLLQHFNQFRTGCFKARGIRFTTGFMLDAFPITDGGMQFSEVEEAINRLMVSKQKPDAIFATSDKLTTGCLKTLNRRGIRVPDDMALVGFSNTDIAELINPSLTVVRQPAMEMGQAAMELLLQLIESKRPITQFEKRILSPTLITGDSSRKK
jgi:LacI family transcriptional regulator